MANFKLTAKTVELSVTGPRTLLNKKAMPYQKRARVESSFFEFFKSDSLIALEDAQHQYKISRGNAPRGRGFPLSVTIKDFIEKSFKRPATRFYSVRILKKTNRRRKPGGSEEPEVIDIEMETASDANVHQQQHAPVETAMEETEVITEGEVGTLNREEPTHPPVLASEAPPATSPPPPPATPGSSRMMMEPEPAPQKPAQLKEVKVKVNNCDPPEAPVKKCSSPDDVKMGGCDNHSVIWDLRAEGIKFDNIYTSVKRNLRSVNNPFLLRTREEIRRLKKTRRNPHSATFWDGIAQRAPLCAHLIDQLFRGVD